MPETPETPEEKQKREERQRNLVEANKEVRSTEIDFQMDMQILLTYLNNLLAKKLFNFNDNAMLEHFKDAIAGIVKSPVFKLEELTDSSKPISFERFGEAKEFYNNSLVVSELYNSINDLIVNNKDKTIQKTLADILEEGGESKKRQLTWQMYLIKPVQRPPKYPLLLREIIKNTPEEETASLTSAFDSISKGLEHINETMHLNKTKRNFVIESLIHKANADIEYLIKNLQEKKADPKILKSIEDIFNNPNVGALEKLRQITLITMPEADLNQIKSTYKNIKQSFSKQVLTIDTLEQQCKTFDSDVIKPNVKKNWLVDQYESFLKRLELEKGYMKQIIEETDVQAKSLSGPVTDSINKKIIQYKRDLMEIKEDYVARTAVFPYLASLRDSGNEIKILTDKESIDAQIASITKNNIGEQIKSVVGKLNAATITSLNKSMFEKSESKNIDELRQKIVTALTKDISDQIYKSKNAPNQQLLEQLKSVDVFLHSKKVTNKLEGKAFNKIPGIKQLRETISLSISQLPQTQQIKTIISGITAAQITNDDLVKALNGFKETRKKIRKQLKDKKTTRETTAELNNRLVQLYDNFIQLLELNKIALEPGNRLSRINHKIEKYKAARDVISQEKSTLTTVSAKTESQVLQDKLKEVANNYSISWLEIRNQINSNNNEVLDSATTNVTKALTALKQSFTNRGSLGDNEFRNNVIDKYCELAMSISAINRELDLIVPPLLETNQIKKLCKEFWDRTVLNNLPLNISAEEINRTFNTNYIEKAKKELYPHHIIIPPVVSPPSTPSSRRESRAEQSLPLEGKPIVPPKGAAVQKSAEGKASPVRKVSISTDVPVLSVENIKQIYQEWNDFYKKNINKEADEINAAITYLNSVALTPSMDLMASVAAFKDTLLNVKSRVEKQRGNSPSSSLNNLYFELIGIEKQLTKPVAPQISPVASETQQVKKSTVVLPVTPQRAKPVTMPQPKSKPTIKTMIVMSDFDATLTAKQPEDLIFKPKPENIEKNRSPKDELPKVELSDFYSSLLRDEKSLNYKSPFKNREEVLKIFKTEFDKYEKTHNGERDPRRITESALAFIKEMISYGKDIDFYIVTNNNVAYVEALLAYEGIDLAKIAITDENRIGLAGKINANHARFYDDKLGQAAAMKEAFQKANPDAKAESTQCVIGVNWADTAIKNIRQTFAEARRDTRTQQIRKPEMVSPPAPLSTAPVRTLPKPPTTAPIQKSIEQPAKKPTTDQLVSQRTRQLPVPPSSKVGAGRLFESPITLPTKQQTTPTPSDERQKITTLPPVKPPRR